MIFLRDINCDFTRGQDDQLINNDAKHMASTYELISFKQLFEESTRVTLETSMIVNHITTTCARHIVKAGVHEASLGDYFVV